jgi:hypothetical protein
MMFEIRYTLSHCIALNEEILDILWPFNALLVLLERDLIAVARWASHQATH